MNSVNCWLDAHACLYWYRTVCEALKTSEDTMTLRHVSRESLSELQRNSLPASFFYCGWNKVVVMQCHDGRETKGTIWVNAIPITCCTHTNYLEFVRDAQNNLKCKQVQKKLYLKCLLINSWKYMNTAHSGCLKVTFYSYYTNVLSHKVCLSAAVCQYKGLLVAVQIHI